jgi:hypothetical protein
MEEKLSDSIKETIQGVSEKTHAVGQSLLKSDARKICENFQ